LKYSHEDIKNLYLEFYKDENFEKFFPHAFELPSQPFHQQINDFFNENPQLAVAIAPRDVGKTTNVTLYKQVLKRIAYRQERCIVVFSKKKDDAANFLATIRKEIKDNRLFSKFYHLSIPTGWTDNAYQVHIKTGSGDRDFIVVIAIGADQDPRGLNIASIRPTLIIHDDYEGKEVRESETIRKKIYKTFWSEVYYSKDAILGKIWFIGTPPHEDSLIWRLHKDPNVPSIFFSSIKDDGTALWEARRPLREIELDRERAEREGSTALAMFYAEIMCDPSPIAMQVLNPEKLRKFNRNEVMKKLARARVYTTVDLQSGGKEGNDYDVMTTVAVTRDMHNETIVERWYILDIRHGRWSEPRKLEILEEIARMYDPIVGIEDVGYQRTFLEAAERYRYEHGIFYKIEALKPRGVRKTERIIGLETPLNTGVVFVPDDNPKWLADLTHEMSVWSPTKDNTHDDILDTLAYIPQLIRLYGGGSFMEDTGKIRWGHYDDQYNKVADVYVNI